MPRSYLSRARSSVDLRRALLLVSLAFTVPLGAQPVAVAPWMTGQQLVELAAWPAAARTPADLTREQDQNQQLAKMFVTGVHDATEGKSWCYGDAAKPKPATLQDYALDGIRAMPAEQRKRAAAHLIAEIWGAKYPCQQGRGKA